MTNKKCPVFYVVHIKGLYLHYVKLTVSLSMGTVMGALPSRTPASTGNLECLSNLTLNLHYSFAKHAPVTFYPLTTHQSL
jgi:hypothetical protein